jgi:hypothetical protein
MFDEIKQMSFLEGFSNFSREPDTLVEMLFSWCAPDSGGSSGASATKFNKIQQTGCSSGANTSLAFGLEHTA